MTLVEGLLQCPACGSTREVETWDKMWQSLTWIGKCKYRFKEFLAYYKARYFVVVDEFAEIEDNALPGAARECKSTQYFNPVTQKLVMSLSGVGSVGFIWGCFFVGFLRYTFRKEKDRYVIYMMLCGEAKFISDVIGGPATKDDFR